MTDTKITCSKCNGKGEDQFSDDNCPCCQGEGKVTEAAYADYVRKNRTLHTGYDTFTPDPGTKESMNCMTCGSDMEVRRNVMGATGFAEAMGRGQHLHDRFTCPNAGLDWHNQIIQIMKAIQNTPSLALQQIMEAELETIKQTKKATKKVSNW